MYRWRVILVLSIIFTAIVLYTATAIDLLVILLIYFARAHTKKEYRDIYIGQFLGSMTLIIISLFLHLYYTMFLKMDAWIIRFNTHLFRH